MGYRLLSYMCRIWENQRREYVAQKLPPGEWRFQPIIPIVFYTGDQRWETLPSLELLMDLPEALRRFIPKFDVLLLDVKRASVHLFQGPRDLLIPKSHYPVRLV